MKKSPFIQETKGHWRIRGLHKASIHQITSSGGPNLASIVPIFVHEDKVRSILRNLEIQLLSTVMAKDGNKS